MFTPSMTREEIVAEAKQDFNQLKAFMQVELNAFGRRYNRKYNNSCIMGSIVHTRTFKTRRHNTWTFFLYIRDYAATRMHAVGCIYIQLNKYDGTSEYLILDLATECLPNLITTHFLQRYKERYLEPNHVKLGGISPALYFFCLGGERKMSNYTPKNWTEEDMEQRFVLISPQGLIVVADEGDLRTFITFLDQENLSRYKAQIYEEEQMIAKVLDCEKHPDGTTRHSSSCKYSTRRMREKSCDAFYTGQTMATGEQTRRHGAILQEFRRAGEDCPLAVGLYREMLVRQRA